MIELVQQMSVGKEKNARSSDSRRDNNHCGGTRRHGNRFGNNVQQTQQELPPQDQIRAKEMKIPDGKTTMTNVDYVGIRAIGQRAAVIVFFLWKFHLIKRNCPRKKRTE